MDLNKLKKPSKRKKTSEIPIEYQNRCVDCEKTNKPAWEIMMEVMCPNIKRPRRTSLHTIATVLGHPDPLALAKEMQDSGKVLGYVCPDVKTPVFYLKKLRKHPGMIDTAVDEIWGNWVYPKAGCNSLSDFLKKNPYPLIKGFKRFGSGGYWDGGQPGKGKFVHTSSGMDVPYEKDDYPYVRLLIKTLREAGVPVGIDEPDDQKGFEGKEYRIFGELKVA